MEEGTTQLHFKAVRMLVGATAFWAISFPITKAIAFLEADLVPGVSTWFYTSLGATTRFGVATLVLLIMCAGSVSKTTRLELSQGIGLGFFGGIGVLAQMDGMAHTSASIAAFLTQTVCVYVPVIVAIRDRKLPGALIVFSTLIMMVGVAILNNISVTHFHLGRGEWETLLAALIFSGQLLWLERPIYKGNDVFRMSLVMFAAMTFFSVPVLLATTQSAAHIRVCFSNPSVLALYAALSLLCTVVAYVTMNKWQPYVPAAEAAIIYGIEPVLTALFALFLPALLSRWAGISYPNETITANLLFGGGLIVAANVILQLPQAKRG